MGELDLEGGIPMSDGSDAMPSDGDIDTLLAGGKPNQDRIPFDEPPSEETGTEIHTDPNAEAKLPEVKDGASVDPIVQQLQGALSKLTPEQRAQLIPPQPAEVVVNGQKMQIPPEKQVPLMQMGLNYSEKMRAFNVERQEFEKAKAQVTENERYYGEIDKVAKAHPEWWQHVQAEYQKFSQKSGNATSAPGSTGEIAPELRAALSKITELEGKLNGYLDKSSKEAELKQNQAEDAELDGQIAAFSKEHPDFDWMTADESGLVLADRIVVHAHKNGINNFRAAARDFLFSDLISRRELKTKEELAKKIQTDTKSGKVTSKAKPSGLSAPKDLHKRDYSDLMSEGYRELGS